MLVEFSRSFLIILSLYANIKFLSAFYSWNVFSLQGGDIWKLLGGKAHMIMIIAIIYIFYVMWYLINSWKLLSENPQPPIPWKNPLPPFYPIPPKIQKV